MRQSAAPGLLLAVVLAVVLAGCRTGPPLERRTVDLDGVTSSVIASLGMDGAVTELDTILDLDELEDEVSFTCREAFLAGEDGQRRRELLVGDRITAWTVVLSWSSGVPSDMAAALDDRARCGRFEEHVGDIPLVVMHAADAPEDVDGVTVWTRVLELDGRPFKAVAETVVVDAATGATVVVGVEESQAVDPAAAADRLAELVVRLETR